MSNPAPPTGPAADSPRMPPPTPAKAQPSAAGRYLFMFLVGLLVGVIGLVMVLRAMEGRKTPMDKWHGSVMNVMAVHSQALRNSVEQNRCSATDLLPHLQTLRAMTNDLEPAFPRLADDARFREHAAGMRAALDASLASPPINCAGAGTVQARVGDSCKACHQDFRG
ncbi:MAG: hypothetical protein Q4F49_06285 [Pseudoxanthomonas suwonensis]|nr:hypothetical protein [Pseudoxanthomonas suwonensis]